MGAIRENDYERKSHEFQIRAAGVAAQYEGACKPRGSLKSTYAACLHNSSSAQLVTMMPFWIIEQIAHVTAQHRCGPGCLRRARLGPTPGQQERELAAEEMRKAWQPSRQLLQPGRKRAAQAMVLRRTAQTQTVRFWRMAAARLAACQHAPYVRLPSLLHIAPTPCLATCTEACMLTRWLGH